MIRKQLDLPPGVARAFGQGRAGIFPNLNFSGQLG
jgi:hypothetical protein